MNRRLSNWDDCGVRANDGDVGTVEQFYFDDLTWIIRYVAVNTGGLPGGNIFISLAVLGNLDWEKRAFHVNLTMAQVRSSPTRDIDEPVSREHEVALHKHYAWPAYWAGGFYIPPGYEPAALPSLDTETARNTPSSGVRKVDSRLRGTREIMGCRVHATDGDIGHVEDFLVDEDSWAIRYLVVNTRNWLPDRRVLVSPRWITRVSWADKKVLMDLTRDAVKKSPKFNPAESISVEYERKLLGHLQKQEATEWTIFKLHAPPGADVAVAGTFNNWDPSAIKMGEYSKGIYTAMVLLPLGRYEYKFIVNGDWRNGSDSSEQVPNVFGTTNSVLIVSRATAHNNVHLHTFSRSHGSEGRPLYTAPIGG